MGKSRRRKRRSRKGGVTRKSSTGLVSSNLPRPKPSGPYANYSSLHKPVDFDSSRQPGFEKQRKEALEREKVLLKNKANAEAERARQILQDELDNQSWWCRKLGMGCPAGGRRRTRRRRKRRRRRRTRRRSRKKSRKRRRRR